MEEQKKATSLVREAVRVLCQNSLTFDQSLTVEGALHVTLDNVLTFRIDINESVGLNNEQVHDEMRPVSNPDISAPDNFNTG